MHTYITIKRQTAFFVGIVGFLMFAHAARAEEVPEAAFQSYYENCMGGASAAQDPQRDQYCGCIRDKMRSWSPQQYAAMSAEMAKSGTPQASPDLEAMAKECISKILK